MTVLGIPNSFLLTSSIFSNSRNAFSRNAFHGRNWEEEGQDHSIKRWFHLPYNPMGAGLTDQMGSWRPPWRQIHSPCRCGLAGVRPCGTWRRDQEMADPVLQEHCRPLGPPPLGYKLRQGHLTQATSWHHESPCAPFPWGPRASETQGEMALEVQVGLKRCHLLAPWRNLLEVNPMAITTRPVKIVADTPIFITRRALNMSTWQTRTPTPLYYLI